MKRQSIKIRVEPSVLKYARYCSGYDISEAALKVGLSKEALTLLESTGTAISFTQLEKISQTYKMPLAYFLLKEKPDDAILPEGFRIIFASTEERLSPRVMLAVRRARYVQSVVQEIGQTKSKYDFNSASIDNNPDQIATYFRSVLGTTTKEQSEWSDPSAALRNWKNSVEKLGIFVLQQSFRKDDVSAFCLVDQSPYIILLNSSEHENRRIFSLFHEVAHILLKQSGVCTPDNLSRNSYEYSRIEKFCNQFAASLLVPLEDFIQDPIVSKLKKLPIENWEYEDVKTLSAQFRVSQEVIYRRMVTIGVLDEAKYQEKRNELIKGFEEYKKGRRAKKVVIPQYRKIISANGTAYSLFVLENLQSNRITLADAADYLDTNTRHIAKVSENVA